MRNKFKILVLGILVSLSSCSNFGDLNDDPNNSRLPYTRGLIAYVIRQGLPDGMGSLYSLYTQQLSQITYTTGSRYDSKRGNYAFWYKVMGNAQKIIDLNTDEKTKSESYVVVTGSNANQIALAKVVLAYRFLKITDSYGPIPFSEALKGTKNLSPKFDSQEAVYDGAFKLLDEAISGFETGSIEGDILFEGDVEKWKQFANSIGVIWSLRLADVSEDKAKAAFAKYSKGIADFDIKFEYLNEDGNKNPWYTNYLTREDYALSKPFVDKLKDLKDPRLPVLADEAQNKSDSEGYDGYVGCPYGLKTSDVVARDVSFIGSEMRKVNTPSYLITRAQLLFSAAEAAQRGWVSLDGKSAQQHYQEAIKASFAQFGLSSSQYEDYVKQPSVAYDAANWKKSIGIQKWIALFLQGRESWAEWRRLDYPKLEVPEDNLNQDGDIPVRRGYPSFEVNLNKVNYKQAVRILGGDDHLSTKLWWDKN